MSNNLQESLTEFSDRVPIFPLPDVVFFPHTFLPLHIFEERYRTMVADVSSGDKLICMTLLKPGYKKDYKGSPPIYSIGTLGYMPLKKSRPDGTYDILLVGMDKVKIKEIPSDTPYRMALVETLKDEVGESDPTILQEKIFQQFDIEGSDNLIAAATRFFREGLDFEMAVNLIITHLAIKLQEKQKLLELNNLSLRAKVLLQYLESGLRVDKAADFGIGSAGDLRMN
ncbi:MAG: LON peptidase substrate-binding domain-containing protein [Fidelibacterota bacterium]